MSPGLLSVVWCITSTSLAPSFIKAPCCCPTVQDQLELEGFAKVDSVVRNKTILIIPVNGGWHDLGFNLWCSLLKATEGKRPNMLFLAFDRQGMHCLWRDGRRGGSAHEAP